MNHCSFSDSVTVIMPAARAQGHEIPRKLNWGDLMNSCFPSAGSRTPFLSPLHHPGPHPNPHHTTCNPTQPHHLWPHPPQHHTTCDPIHPHTTPSASQPIITLHHLWPPPPPHPNICITMLPVTHTTWPHPTPHHLWPHPIPPRIPSYTTPPMTPSNTTPHHVTPPTSHIVPHHATPHYTTQDPNPTHITLPVTWPASTPPPVTLHHPIALVTQHHTTLPHPTSPHLWPTPCCTTPPSLNHPVCDPRQPHNLDMHGLQMWNLIYVLIFVQILRMVYHRIPNLQLR